MATGDNDLDEPLPEQKQKRDGSLIVFQCDDEQIVLWQRLLKHSVVTRSALLDLKFQVTNLRTELGVERLATATSTGSIAIFQLVISPNGGCRIEPFVEYQIATRDVVVTAISLDPQNNAKLCASFSTGEICVVDTSPELWQSGYSGVLTSKSDRALTVIAHHELEAWTICYAPVSWPQQGVWSGGDDAILRFTSVSDGPIPPAGATEQTFGTVQWSNRKIHAAGVTAILPLAKGIIATGGYDDHLRIVEVPIVGTGRPKVLHELDIGGGVWRLKCFHSFELGAKKYWKILVCGMYAGAFIVRVALESEQQVWTADIMSHLSEHESMCYGADVLAYDGENSLRGGERCDSDPLRTFVSCSFYDKRLCLWQA